MMNAEVRKAVKKPVEVEFMVWPGGASNAIPVIDWILSNGLAKSLPKHRRDIHGRTTQPEGESGV